MRPFRMFFGMSIAVILFFFVAKVVFVAFIAAVIMSILYAVFRRLKDFVTYDRYGEYYIPPYDQRYSLEAPKADVEPLFFEHNADRRTRINNIRFIDTV